MTEETMGDVVEAAAGLFARFDGHMDQDDLDLSDRILAALSIRSAPSGDGVWAWSYDLATYYNKSTGEYSGWESRLSREKPCVPDRSIRNLTALTPAPSEASGDVVEAHHVEAALATFDGGLIRQNDERNSRGYTTHYHPKDSMRAVLEQFLDSLTPAPQADALRIGMSVEHGPSGAKGRIVANVEGWWEVLLSDGTTVVCRPSNLTERQTDAD